MNLNGIGYAPTLLRPAPSDARRVDHHPAGHPGAVAPATVPQAPRETPAAAELNRTLPVEAPAGTDPELWSVLSAEERGYFAKVGSMGPLTYGHLLTSARSDAPVLRGGRLDVRA